MEAENQDQAQLKSTFESVWRSKTGAPQSFTSSNGRTISFQTVQPGGYSMERKWVHVTGAFSDFKDTQEMINTRESVARHHAMYSLLCMDKRYRAYRAENHPDADPGDVPVSMTGLIWVCKFSEELGADHQMGQMTFNIKLGILFDLYRKIKPFVDDIMWNGLRDWATLGSDVEEGDPADVFLKTTPSPYESAMPALGDGDYRDGRTEKSSSSSSTTNITETTTFEAELPNTMAPMTEIPLAPTTRISECVNPFASPHKKCAVDISSSLFRFTPGARTPDPTNPFYLPPDSSNSSSSSSAEPEPPAEETIEQTHKGTGLG